MPDAGEPQIPDVYADGYNASFSPFTASLVFTVRRGANEVQPVATVRMSLEHAKLMAILFKRAVKEIESTFGMVISLPPGLLEEKGISLETDW